MVHSLESLREVKPRLEEIAARHGVSNIRVFGSVARGEAKEGSDVDLLIDISSDRSLWDLIGFESETATLLGMKVEAVTTPALHPLIASTIARDLAAV